jgi:hypothetical protein
MKNVLDGIVGYDPKGWRKHFLIGGMWELLWIFLYFEWKGVILGLFTLFIGANLWEFFWKIVKKRKMSGMDVLKSMLGGVIGALIGILIMCVFLMMKIEWYGILG